VTVPGWLTPRATIADRMGAEMLLDILAAAEGAEMDARKMRHRAQEAVAKFGRQRGYLAVLPPQEAARLARLEAEAAQADRYSKARRKRRAACDG